MSAIFNWGLLKDDSHVDFLLVDTVLITRTRVGSGEWHPLVYRCSTADAARAAALAKTGDLEASGYEMLLGVYAAPVPPYFMRAYLANRTAFPVETLMDALSGTWEPVR